MNADQAGGWWAAGLLGAILVCALIRQQLPHPIEPARRDPRAAESGMVDALPGLGPKRLEPVREAVRAGELSRVPKPARGVAEQVFMQP